ncbi:MAG: hypothetical protein ACFFCL_01930 [Promethearchaeota archaeon]
MSSGKIEQNYFKNIENGLIFNESVIFSENYLPKSHFSGAKSPKEKMYSNIDNKLQQPYREVLDDHLDMIQKIDFILKNSHDLTQKQKYDYCITQRFYMKLYLKGISNRS